MGLFTQVIKKGAKVVDGLLDDAAVQAKKVDPPEFDEAAWLLENPRPYPDVRLKDMTETQRKEHTRWRVAKHRASRPPEKHAEDNIKARDKLRAQPPEVAEMRKKRVREYRESDLERDKEGQIRSRARRSEAQVRKAEARAKELRDKKRLERANTEGYDSEGRRILPETTLNTKFTHQQRRRMRRPPWANLDSLREVKEARQIMEMDSGILLEADHATPLVGNFVSGLDLADNIQILPKDYHAQFGAQTGVGKNSLLSTPESRANKYQDHLIYTTDNAGDIAYRQSEKQKFVKGFSEQLSHDILSPHTKVGKNARELWGEDAQKYLSKMRKELGLLGV